MIIKVTINGMVTPIEFNDEALQQIANVINAINEDQDNSIEPIVTPGTAEPAKLSQFTVNTNNGAVESVSGTPIWFPAASGSIVLTVNGEDLDLSSATITQIRQHIKRKLVGAKVSSLDDLSEVIKVDGDKVIFTDVTVSEVNTI